MRAFDLPAGATGTLTGTYEQDGRQFGWVTVDTPAGPLYATGVRLDELETVDGCALPMDLQPQR